MKKEYTVYILRCNDDSFYVGLTSNLPLRVFQHQCGVYTSAYTYSRRPIAVAYTAIFTDVYEAISWERRLKRWSRRKKEALIGNRWNALICYAARRKPFTSVDLIRSIIARQWRRARLRDTSSASSSG